MDIATDARPEKVTALIEAAGYKVVPTGIAHGTVTVVADHHPYEVTTFRRDLETDGRRARVAFADDVAEDARRRDFTMNALYADAEGTVVDPLGGLGDLERRCVRFVGEAEARIREDYLRILRFFRFHAWYGDPAEGLDPEGLAACAGLADGLERLSRERVGHETLRLLAAADPAPVGSGDAGGGRAAPRPAGGRRGGAAAAGGGRDGARCRSRPGAAAGGARWRGCRAPAAAVARRCPPPRPAAGAGRRRGRDR